MCGMLPDLRLLTIRQSNEDTDTSYGIWLLQAKIKIKKLFTVAQKCHGTNKNFTAQTKTSRHKQELHGTNENLTAKTKTLTAQTKTLTAQTKTLTAQTKTSRHKRKLHGTNKNFTAQTKTLTAEVNLTAEMAVYFTRAVTQSLKIWRNQ